MKTRILKTLMGIATISVLLCGCGANTESQDAADSTEVSEAADTDTEDTDTEDTDTEDTDDAASTDDATTADQAVYESEDGNWKVTYDTNDFAVNDALGDGQIGFVYQGECAGTSMVIVSYVADEMPDEVLYEKTADYDQDSIVRGESYFGSESYWSHYRNIKPENTDPEAGDVVYEDFTAVEHNGGTILIETMTHGSNDEDLTMTVSDKISALMYGIELVNHEPQTEYAYMVGTYTYEDADGNTETITLNDDHTCTATLSDDVTGDYTGTEIYFSDGNTCEFTVEGDDLMINMDGDWITFSK